MEPLCASELANQASHRVRIVRDRPERPHLAAHLSNRYRDAVLV